MFSLTALRFPQKDPGYTERKGDKELMFKKIFGVVIGFPFIVAFVLAIIYSQATTIDWNGKMIGSNFKISSLDSSLPISERGNISFIEPRPYDRLRPYKCKVLIRAPLYAFGLEADTLDADLKKGRQVDKIVIGVMAKASEKGRDEKVVETFNKIIESPDLIKSLGGEELKLIPPKWLDIIYSSGVPQDIKACYSRAINQLILEKCYADVIPKPFTFGENQLLHVKEAWVSKDDARLISEFESLPVSATYMLGDYKNPVWVIWKIKPLQEAYRMKIINESLDRSMRSLKELEDDRHFLKDYQEILRSQPNTSEDAPK